MDHVEREDAPSPQPGISYAIARLQQLVLGSVSDIASKHDLTALQFTTLSVLNRHGAPLSNSQLARRSFMTAQSMHEVIDRLERAGLIKRNAHPNHGRKRPASLTAKGRRVLSACESAVAAFETRMLRGFSRADQAKFLAMLKTAVSSLGGGFDGAKRPFARRDKPSPASRRAHASHAA
jgi:DNA-binding MarR family transcriptional regulator